MRITEVVSTDLFSGSAARPLQIVRVTLVNDGPGMISDPAGQVTVGVHGAGVVTPGPVMVTKLHHGEQRTVEVPVEIAAPAAPGVARRVTAVAQSATGHWQVPGQITVAEPGWTMWMVSHFHYDPVWWNTQGQYTQTWPLLPSQDGSLPEVRTAFELVRLHLREARQDPDYKFVMAEIDYLKPYFDAHPEDRADLLALLADGRIEIVGGNYNEPNTNLTCAESTIRNAMYGLAFQREVLGAAPTTSWMLDAFGFDPSYPGLMAAAGLAESSWARGPFHQWGPEKISGGNRRMQFPADFEWLSPDGNGLLTSYMPNHYSAGWITQHATDLVDCRGGRIRPVPLPRSGRGHPQRAAARGRRPRGAVAVGHGDPQGLEHALRLAAVRDGRAARVLRGGPRRADGERCLADAPDQGHEPGLSRQRRHLH